MGRRKPKPPQERIPNVAFAEALSRTAPAPLWLCRLVLETRTGDLPVALRMVRDIVRELPPGDDETSGRAAAERWLEDHDTPATREARQMVASGVIFEARAGYLTRGVATCPMCMVRRKFPGFSPEACPTCGTWLIRLGSVGCVVGPDTSEHVAAINAAVEQHVRLTINPRFSWQKVTNA